MALTFDDIYRQQGINTGPAPMPAQPTGGTQTNTGVNFGPVPNNLYDYNQSDLWNLLNGRTQSVGTAFQTGQQWNPDQYTDSASRMNAWTAMGRPNTDYLGRTTTGQDGGGAIRQNFQQVLGMPTTQAPQAPQNYGNMNFPQVQNTFNPNMQPNRGGFSGYGGYQQPNFNMQGMTGYGGYDFSNPMNYSGYGNWNQPRQQTGKGYGR